MKRSWKYFNNAAVAAIFSCLLVTGCATSDAELAKAKAQGAQEQAQKVEAQKQQDDQAKLAAQVKSLSDAAEKEKAAKKKAAKEKAAKEKAAKEKAEKTAAKKAASPSSAATSCGGNVSVGSNTTCTFAFNVARDYIEYGGGSGQFYSYSPVTGTSYLMTCRAGVPTICRGGNNAVVYIR